MQAKIKPNKQTPGEQDLMKEFKFLSSDQKNNKIQVSGLYSEQGKEIKSEEDDFNAAANVIVHMAKRQSSSNNSDDASQSS